MATKAIFYGLVIAPFILGILSLCFSYVDVVGITAVSNAVAGIPNTPGVAQLSNDFLGIAYFWPTVAALMCIMIVAEAWASSFFIRSHPLAAAVASGQLVLYLIASFYVSNIVLTVARLNVFAGIVPSANLLLLMYINMPILLLVCGGIDLAIALTVATR